MARTRYVPGVISTADQGDLVLNGESKPAQMQLKAVELDGKRLTPTDYHLTGHLLTIPSRLLPADGFTLEVLTTLEPHKNTSLSGLYVSSGNYCTQMEAEGFRNLTFFVDRPDNMAIFKTRIEADQERFPWLLSNGNPVGSGTLADGRHFVEWDDPHPKPCYLFAVVAGDFRCIEDSFVTRSGREVSLRIFVEPGFEDQTAWAMTSLKHSFEWDEQRFNREYDLDQFNLVAVSDFNMGAMENKSLNVFNSKYVLAKPETATDGDYEAIEGVIGHEYFHNWSGNRVTCRDWFQLTLKEGLTVYRDQEFTADMRSRPVKRIRDVQRLRAAQFKEDAGPMAHPIRPESYIAIDNFYTATVYEKGAEVVRMIATIVGDDGFKAGLDHYFDKHDGKAVTCEDFVVAIEEATGADLRQFRRWYSQPGTPKVSARHAYADGVILLTLTQNSDRDKHPDNLPYDIPIAVGIVDRATGVDVVPTQVLRLTEHQQDFLIECPANASSNLIPSILRSFSAPVELDSDLSVEDLAFLSKHDSDPFNRYEAAQQIATRTLLAAIGDQERGHGGNGDSNCDPTQDELEQMITGLRSAAGPGPSVIEKLLVDCLVATFHEPELDASFKALVLTLPSEGHLAGLVPAGTADAMAIRKARRNLTALIADGIGESALIDAVTRTSSASDRELAAMSLRLLCTSPGMELRGRALATEIFSSAGATMSHRIMGLAALNDLDCDERAHCLAQFYMSFSAEPLVVNKWLGMIGSSAVAETPDAVARLAAGGSGGVFSTANPNQVYSLVGGFASSIHLFTQRGSQWFGDMILELDAKNPQVAARLMTAISGWRKYVPEQAKLLQAQLDRISTAPGVSNDVFEIATKSLR